MDGQMRPIGPLDRQKVSHFLMLEAETDTSWPQIGLKSDTDAPFGCLNDLTI
jgi:hypothetical protein